MGSASQPLLELGDPHAVVVSWMALSADEALDEQLEGSRAMELHEPMRRQRRKLGLREASEEFASAIADFPAVSRLATKLKTSANEA